MVKLKKETWNNAGRINGYYTGYMSIYSDKISATESSAIREAMKKMGGVAWIYEVRFHLDCKSFTKRNAYYQNCIGEIDNYRRDRPIYKSIVANRVHKTYLLSKDGKKIRTL